MDSEGFVSDLDAATAEVLARKNEFLVLEKIFCDSKVLDGYLAELQKLKNYKKLRNYAALEKDIEVVLSFTENSLLFKSLHNAIKQDLFRFLDEVQNSFLESLDLSFPSAAILSDLELQPSADFLQARLGSKAKGANGQGGGAIKCKMPNNNCVPIATTNFLIHGLVPPAHASTAAAMRPRSCANTAI